MVGSVSFRSNNNNTIHIGLATVLALLSYIPFHYVAKISLIVLGLLFIFDPFPPTSRIVALLSLFIVRLISNYYVTVQQQLQQQEEDKLNEEPIVQIVESTTTVTNNDGTQQQQQQQQLAASNADSSFFSPTTSTSTKDKKDK